MPTRIPVEIDQSALAKLKLATAGRLEFFEPAPLDQLQLIKARFPGFVLAQYLDLLAQSDGVGEIFDDCGQRFVHNMLVFTAEQALHWSQESFANGFLVIGAPGVDGIFFGLRPGHEAIRAHMPIDREFVVVAASVTELVRKWLDGELRL